MNAAPMPLPTVAALRAQVDDPAAAAAAPDALFERLAHADAALRRQAAGELAELYNLTWREGQMPVAEDDFAAALTLTAIGLRAGRPDWLRYAAPALIGAATVVLYADAQPWCFRACIEG